MGNSDRQLSVFGRTIRRHLLCGGAGWLPPAGWRSPLRAGSATRRLDRAVAGRDRFATADLRPGSLVSLLQAVRPPSLAEPNVDRFVVAGAVQRRRLCVLLDVAPRRMANGDRES